MYAGNSGSASNDGSGAFFDVISIKGPCSHTNEKAPCRGYDAGAETTAEGLWAMVLIKNAIQKYLLGSKFTFNE
uniref:Uncharacterized protein n=1 Tax=Acrobeloides nanus TaxID=290746 RepID=A0A914CQJ8_9BILA